MPKGKRFPELTHVGMIDDLNAPSTLEKLGHYLTGDVFVLFRFDTAPLVPFASHSLRYSTYELTLDGPAPWKSRL